MLGMDAEPGWLRAWWERARLPCVGTRCKGCTEEERKLSQGIAEAHSMDKGTAVFVPSDPEAPVHLHTREPREIQATPHPAPVVATASQKLGQRFPQEPWKCQPGEAVSRPSILPHVNRRIAQCF